MSHALLSVEETAIALWGEDSETAKNRTRRLLHEGKIDGIRVGARWFIPRAAIQRLQGDEE